MKAMIKAKDGGKQLICFNPKNICEIVKKHGEIIIKA